MLGVVDGVLAQMLDMFLHLQLEQFDDICTTALSFVHFFY
jgi:hypothetical protein